MKRRITAVSKLYTYCKNLQWLEAMSNHPWRVCDNNVQTGVENVKHAWFLGNFLRVTQNVTCQPPCLFSFWEGIWNESNPVSTQVQSAVWSPDHTSPVILRYFAFWRWLQQPERRRLLPYLRLQSPCKGHRHLACKGASVPLLFFVQFYPQTTPNFGQQRQKHHRFSFVGFSMALWKFAPCLCKNWSKTFFLLSECPFFPLQCLIQNFIEQLFGRWMSEKPEEMEGRTAAQKGVVVPSQLNGREPGKLKE